MPKPTITVDGISIDSYLNMRTSTEIQEVRQSIQKENKKKRTYYTRPLGALKRPFKKLYGEVKQYTQEEILMENLKTDYQAREEELLQEINKPKPNKNRLVIGALCSQNFMNSAAIAAKLTRMKLPITSNEISGLMYTMLLPSNRKPIRYIIERQGKKGRLSYRVNPLACKLPLDSLHQLTYLRGNFTIQDAVSQIPQLQEIVSQQTTVKPKTVEKNISDKPIVKEDIPPIIPQNQNVTIPQDINININFTVRFKFS